MKHILSLLLFTLCCLPQVQAQNCEIYGILLDETGAPFAGVRTEVFQQGKRIAGTATEDDGIFSLRPLSTGAYNVVFTARDYSTLTITGVLLHFPNSSAKLSGKMLPGNISDTRTIAYVRRAPDTLLPAAQLIKRMPARQDMHGCYGNETFGRYRDQKRFNEHLYQLAENDPKWEVVPGCIGGGGETIRLRHRFGVPPPPFPSYSFEPEKQPMIIAPAISYNAGFDFGERFTEEELQRIPLQRLLEQVPELRR